MDVRKKWHQHTISWLCPWVRIPYLAMGVCDAAFASSDPSWKTPSSRGTTRVVIKISGVVYRVSNRNSLQRHLRRFFLAQPPITDRWHLRYPSAVARNCWKSCRSAVTNATSEIAKAVAAMFVSMPPILSSERSGVYERTQDWISWRQSWHTKSDISSLDALEKRRCFTRDVKDFTTYFAESPVTWWYRSLSCCSTRISSILPKEAPGSETLRFWASWASCHSEAQRLKQKDLCRDSYVAIPVIYGPTANRNSSKALFVILFEAFDNFYWCFVAPWVYQAGQ